LYGLATALLAAFVASGVPRIQRARIGGMENSRIRLRDFVRPVQSKLHRHAKVIRARLPRLRLATAASPLD
jgi:hypothetical protein